MQLKLKATTQATTVANVAADVIRLDPNVKLGQPGATPTPVVISADKSIKYETVVKVMDQLQKAGVVRVGLSVQSGK